MKNRNSQQKFRLMMGSYLLHLMTIMCVAAPFLLTQAYCHGASGDSGCGFCAKNSRAYLLSVCSILLTGLIYNDLMGDFNIGQYEIRYGFDLFDWMYRLFKVYAALTVIFLTYELFAYYKHKINLFKEDAAQKPVLK